MESNVAFHQQSTKRQRSVTEDFFKELEGKKKLRLPGVKTFADAVPYPKGHPFAEIEAYHPRNWQNISESSSSSGSTTANVNKKGKDKDKDKEKEQKKKEREQKKLTLRQGKDGQTWEDPTLREWPENDFRLYVGNVGPEISSDMLAEKFKNYPSFAKAKVVPNKDKHPNRAGFGFVSFLDLDDYYKAFAELNGKYLGSRPMQLEKSKWREAHPDVVQAKIDNKPLWLK